MPGPRWYMLKPHASVCLPFVTGQKTIPTDLAIEVEKVLELFTVHTRFVKYVLPNHYIGYALKHSFFQAVVQRIRDNEHKKN